LIVFQAQPANGARHEHRKSGNFAAFAIVRYFSDAEGV
jgi:hypothetical protein